MIDKNSGKKIVSPLDFIEVYPSGKCFCPSYDAEVNQNLCAACSYYVGHSINNRGDASPVFYVTCSFSLVD